MIDLFGKKKCEDRIYELQAALEELQKEKSYLSKALEKRDEKIRKLSSAYQEANLALKAAEQRPSLAQDATQAPPEEAQKVSGQKLYPSEVMRLHKKLKGLTSAEADLTSAYVRAAEALPPGIDCPSCRSGGSERGWIFYQAPQLFTLAMVPPLPIEEDLVESGSAFLLDPLEAILETPVLVVSAHAGDTLIGVALSFRRFEVIEVVKSQVKEKHSKGGWSQKRFERLREEDIKIHIQAVEEKLKEVLEGYGPLAKFAVIGGDQAIVKEVVSAITLPIIERRLERHDSKRPEEILEEIYGFTCYRS